MTFKAFDVHTHRMTGERAKAAESKLSDAHRMFGGNDGPQDPIEYYRSRDMMAVVFDVDAETETGIKINNDEVARLVESAQGLFLGFASVDPWKGKAAIREIERCKAMGMRGVKLQPITQAFFLNERRFYPIWDACQQMGLPLLVHSGTTAIGNGSPGGRGLHLKYGEPIPAIDDVAADFPDLTIIAAHPGWPWHLELMAVARHKGNVFVDLSGWAPKYFPQEVVTYFNSVMPDKFLFGSDYPLFTPDRWMAEFEKLPIKDAVRPKILYENACRLFGVDTALFG